MAKPGPVKKHNPTEDYKVKVVDRRSKYQADKEQILSKGLSKTELDKSLRTLRHEFIDDLRKLSNDNITKAISSFYSKQTKSEDKKKNVPKVKTTEIEKSLSSLVTSTSKGNQESSKGSNKLREALNSVKNKIEENFGDVKSTFVSSGFGTIASLLGKMYTTVGQIASGINSLFTGSIEQAITDQLTNMGSINARLYGLTEQFDDVTDSDHNYYEDLMGDITAKFLNNSYVNQQTLWSNIKKLVDQGIGFNLEERAYLMTLSDKLVSTFDATNNTLLQAIRLNQYDLTQAQLGAESLLLEYFNKNFQDSSYLTDQYDSVYAAIQDALSQMNYADATEFNYNLQKWLGSLYEVGASGSLVSTLASGINMLATGDVSGLEGNTSLQNLLVMGATKAGLSYSDILTNGLDSDTLNQLMGSIVSYLQDIADNTDNEVVKNAWKSIVGVGVSDLRAIQNLSDDTIESLTGTTATFEDAINATLTQFEALEGENRISTSERISNQMNNLLYSVGATLVNNEALYEQYRKVGMVQDIISYISDGLGVAGDLIEAFTSPINAMLQNNAIMEAFSSVMQASGYNGYEGTVRNVDVQGTFAQVDENGNLTALDTSTLVSYLVENYNGDTEGAKQYLEDNNIIGYKTDGMDGEAVLSAIQEAGYIWKSFADMSEEEKDTYNTIEETVDDGSATLDEATLKQAYNNYLNGLIDETNSNLYTAYHPKDATGMWVREDGGFINPDDLGDLTGGVSSVEDTTDKYGYEIDDDATEQLLKAVLESQTYGWGDLLGMIMESGWDPINNGLGSNPFSSTTSYTKRGTEIYGVTDEGLLDTSNQVGTTAEESSYVGDTKNQANAIQIGTGGTEETAPSTVTGGTSASMEMITETSDNFETLGTNEAQIQAQTQVISSTQEETSKTLEELYTALFVEGRTVSVSLANIGADIWTAIDNRINEATNSIKARLDETINVNVENNSSSNYFDLLASTKEW